MPLEWKVVSQRNWLKGLQATFNRFSQPQGVTVRLSNLLYDIRGGLRTTDGSEIFTQLLGATQTEGPINEIALYSPSGQQPYYVGIMKSKENQLPAPAAPTLLFLTVGGAITSIVYAGPPASIATVTFAAAHNLTANSNSNGQLIITGNTNSVFNITVLFSQIQILSPTTISIVFNNSATQSGTGGSMTTALASSMGLPLTYSVTASDGQGGETPASPSITGSASPPYNAVQISWTAVPGAVGYNVYGRMTGSIGQINQNGNLLAGLVTGTSMVDLGGVVNPPQPPTTNTTQTVVVYLMTAPTFQQVLGVFPSYFAPALGNIPGASSPPPNTQGFATPEGGVPGATGPLPQILQFANELIFAFGNGYPPQYYLDQASGGDLNLHPLQNTFNAQYTDWQASVAWNQGDTIKDSVSGGLFQATQAGTSAATRPAFNNTLNALTPEVSPGTVVWKCIATSSTGTPLRGAACEIVYAGSLWIANTWPTTTSDQLDGPNCIKMSDVNNPNSWNPANVAFLDKDDGDQITSLATFTIAESGISPTGSLVVFKNFSTYQITGVFGDPNLTIQKAQTDMGNVAPRTTQFIPGYGITRLTHLGFAYFEGVRDKLISEEIRPYLFGGPPDIAPIDWNYAYLSKAAQAADPPMYVAACPIKQPVLTGVTVHGTAGPSTLFVRVEQLVNGNPVAITPEFQVTYSGAAAFTVTTPGQVTGITYRVFAGSVPGGENVFVEQPLFFNQTVTLSSMTPGFLSFGNGGLTRIFAYDLVQKQWAVVDLPFAISALKQIRSPGTVPITIAGGANDGAVRRLFSGDVTWDTGGQIIWAMRAGELYQQGASAKMFFRRLVIRGTNNLNALLTVTVNLQGTDAVMGRGTTNHYLGGPNGAQQWELRIDIMKDAENANVMLSGSGPAQIQLDSIDWYVKPKQSGAPVTIQK